MSVNISYFHKMLTAVFFTLLTKPKMSNVNIIMSEVNIIMSEVNIIMSDCECRGHYTLKM